jgi:hypothetical protein
LQVTSAQTPEAHESEQHSPEVVQDFPAGVQNAVETQMPPEQMPEQHSAALPQTPPASRQTDSAFVQIFTDVFAGSVAQYPVQQSESAAHCVVSDLHWSAGSVQTPFAQRFVQQDTFVKQVVPAPVQLEVQRSPAQPRPAQHWLGTAQVAPDWPQAGTRQVPPWHVRPLQQSPSARQSPPVSWQVTGAVQAPFVQLSVALQQGWVVQAAPVSAHTTGATQVLVPSRSGSVHESPA